MFFIQIFCLERDFSVNFLEERNGFCYRQNKRREGHTPSLAGAHRQWQLAQWILGFSILTTIPRVLVKAVVLFKEISRSWGHGRGTAQLPSPALFGQWRVWKPPDSTPEVGDMAGARKEAQGMQPLGRADGFQSCQAQLPQGLLCGAMKTLQLCSGVGLLSALTLVGGGPCMSFCPFQNIALAQTPKLEALCVLPSMTLGRSLV